MTSGQNTGDIVKKYISAENLPNNKWTKFSVTLKNNRTEHQPYKRQSMLQGMRIYLLHNTK